MERWRARKVVIVGAGAVGSTFAYALAQSGVADEIALIDMDANLAQGQVMDLAHGLPFYPNVQISMDGRGRAMDNVFTERLWRSVKYEEVYLKDYTSPREARQGIGQYLTFYNYERPHQSLDYRTPAEVYLLAKVLGWPGG